MPAFIPVSAAAGATVAAVGAALSAEAAPAFPFPHAAIRTIALNDKNLLTGIPPSKCDEAVWNIRVRVRRDLSQHLASRLASSHTHCVALVACIVAHTRARKIA